jgi:hypothetical protein
MQVELLSQKESVRPGPASEKVQRVDGKEDKWAPKFLHVAQALASFTRIADRFKVKLSDLGGGESSSPPMLDPPCVARKMLGLNLYIHQLFSSQTPQQKSLRRSASERLS